MRVAHRPGLRRPVVASTIVLAATAIAAPIAPVGAASPAAPACKVTNVATKKSAATLQAAVDAAKARQTLQVRGTCTGTTTIGKRLTIVGVPTRALGKPALVGPGGARVLLVSPGATVTITTLTIRGGDVSAAFGYPTNTGGGIRNEGALTLRNVVVSGNKAVQGGGISSTGRLTLTGTTRIGGNSADVAGGVDLEGETTTAVLLMTDRARVNGNTTGAHSGGLYAYKGRITMAGRSQIDHNTAGTHAGGVNLVQSNLTLTGRATIHHNKATAGDGGGIHLANGVIKLTVDSRVYLNTAGTDGGGIRTNGGAVVMRDRAQVDHNSGTRSAGGMELYPGNLTMHDASSVHHNTGGYAGGIEAYSDSALENRVTMNDTSSVYANIATSAGGVMGISMVGDLVMNDKSVVRSHVSATVGRAVEIYQYVGPATPSITMTGQSRIRNNVLAAGFGALTFYPNCNIPTSASGVNARVVSNSPVNIFTAPGC